MSVKKTLFILMIALILLALLFWIGSIIYCEILTARYGDDFIEAAEELEKMVEIDRWKVLKYSENYAEVYYVSQYGGSLASYIRQNGDWVRQSRDAIWSASGSADGFIWPYIRMPLWGATIPAGGSGLERLSTMP